jgi:hypothetical protein
MRSSTFEIVNNQPVRRGAGQRWSAAIASSASGMAVKH